jgi:hypothetical protein
MAFLELVQKQGGGDFLKDLAQTVLQRLMEFDVEGLVGAGRYERSDARTTQRNGFREREFDTRLGTLDLKIHKLRKGSYFPAFLEPRKTAERALVAVVQEAWIQGVSTRKVGDLVQAMGMTASRKARSRPCARTSTSASPPSSIGQSKANGPICRFRFQYGTGGLRNINALREISPAAFSVSIETESTFFRLQLGLIDRVIVLTINACRVPSTTQTTRVGLKPNAEIFFYAAC